MSLAVPRRAYVAFPCAFAYCDVARCKEAAIAIYRMVLASDIGSLLCESGPKENVDKLFAEPEAGRRAHHREWMA
ncbi:hypothetical protein [Pectobacterium sp. F1-1]|nr:hypothetical protein [Pectobacterium sp. F1-1]